MSQAKRKTLFFLILAGLLVMILAMSLPGLQLAPGQPFSLGQDKTEAGAGGGAFAVGEWALWAFRGLMALVIVLLPVYIIISLLTPEGRRRLLSEVILLAFLLVVAEYLSRMTREAADKTQEAAGEMTFDIGQLAVPGPPPVTFSATPPPWLTWGIIFILSLLVVALGIGAVWLFRQRRKPPKTTWQRLAQEAQNAIDSLQIGVDFRTTILHCYREMMRVIREERGIARETGMTPREFERILIQKGLPQEPIVGLTRLFENVRYGSLPVSKQEEKMALWFLAEIARACKSMGEPNAVQ